MAILAYLLWVGLIMALYWWARHEITKDERARRRQDRADIARIRAAQRRVVR